MIWKIFLDKFLSFSQRSENRNSSIADLVSFLWISVKTKNQKVTRFSTPVQMGGSTILAQNRKICKKRILENGT